MSDHHTYASGTPAEATLSQRAAASLVRMLEEPAINQLAERTVYTTAKAASDAGRMAPDSLDIFHITYGRLVAIANGERVKLQPAHVSFLSDTLTQIPDDTTRNHFRKAVIQLHSASIPLASWGDRSKAPVAPTSAARG